MTYLIKISQLLLFIILLTSCKTTDEKGSLIKDSKNQEKKDVNINKRTMEIRISCDEGDITKFINDGWTIAEEYSEEKVCTWKSFPATKNCDIEKDKGCKITKPDKIGEEKIYLLER